MALAKISVPSDSDGRTGAEKAKAKDTHHKRRAAPPDHRCSKEGDEEQQLHDKPGPAAPFDGSNHTHRRLRDR
jgi:hypothetical protein